MSYCRDALVGCVRVPSIWGKNNLTSLKMLLNTCVLYHTGLRVQVRLDKQVLSQEHCFK